MYTQQYIPNKGIIASSIDGAQRIGASSGEAFNFYSALDSGIKPLNKFCLDSCWETGNIFYVSSGDNTLRRINYDGTNEITNVFSGPTAISVIQNHPTLPSDVADFSSESAGCWLIDYSIGTLFRMNANLVVNGTIDGFDNPSHIVSSPDGGCYVADDTAEKIYKINSDVEVEGFIDYSSLTPSLSSGTIKRFRTDKNNNLWVLANGVLYILLYDDGGITQGNAVNVYTDVGVLQTQVVDFDLSRGNDVISAYAYVTGGCSGNTFIIKYNEVLNIVVSRTNINHFSPVTVSVPQYANAISAVYVIEDLSATPPDCTDESSSTSSESSESSEEETSEGEHFYTKIHKFSSYNLTDISSLNLFMNNMVGMTMDHTLDCTKQFSNTIAFSITAVNNHIPHIYDEEFVVVVRERVDFRSMGPDYPFVKEQGKDIGQMNYINSSPNPTVGLMAGFEELRRNNV